MRATRLGGSIGASAGLLCAYMLLSSCGGDGRAIVLARKYRVGDVYDTRQVCAARGLTTLRSDMLSTMTVTAANTDGSATLRVHTKASAVWLIRRDVGLPPLRVADRRVSEFHVDARGRVTRAAPLQPNVWMRPNLDRPWEPELGVLPDLSDTVPFPASAVRVGAEWTTPSGLKGPIAGVATGNVTHTLREVDASRLATISSEGTLRWPQSEGGGSLVVTPDSELQFSLDSLAATSRLRMDVVGRSDALGAFDSIVCDACVARSGSACRIDDADATVPFALMHAADYTGAACAPRVARMRAYMQRLKAAEGGAFARNAERLAVVRGVVGTVPEISPLLEVSMSGVLTLDGRVVDQGQLLRDLDTLDRNWAILHPGTPSPNRVSAPLDATAPAATAAGVLSAVRASGRTVALLVANGLRAPPPPPAPRWLTNHLGTRGVSAANPNFQTANAIAAGVCFAVARLYAGVAAADAAAKFSMMLDGLPDVVAACDCGGLDIDAIEYMVASIAIPGPVVRAFDWDGRTPEPSDVTVEQWFRRIAPHS